MTEQELKLFKGYCAKIMGWHRGTGCYSHEYYHDSGGFACMIDEYDPYNDLIKLLPVIDSLISSLGLHLNSGTVQREGLLAACRELIVANIPPEFSNHALVADNKIDTTVPDVSKIFNEACATVMGYYRGRFTGGLFYFELDAQMICPVDKYNPYDDLNLLAPVVDSIVNDGEYRLYQDEVSAMGTLKAWREYVTEALNLDVNESDFLDVLEPWDKRSGKECPPITNFGYSGCNSPVDNKLREAFPEHSKFNEQCREILMTHTRDTGGVLIPGDYDAYFDTSNLLQIMEIVLGYLPDNITFIIGGRKRAMEVNMVEEIRSFVKAYGTDEWMLTEEEEFNKNCRKLCVCYNIVDCRADCSDFDPYNNMEDLAPILPIIIRRVDEHFMITASSDSQDVHVNMRDYVMDHAKKVIKIVEG